MTRARSVPETEAFAVIGAERAGAEHALSTLFPLAAWAVLFNIVGKYTWGYGPLTFTALMGIALLLGAQVAAPRRFGRYVPRRLRGGAVCRIHVLLIAILLGLAVHHACGTYAVLRFKPDWVIDIAANTQAAGDAFLRGANPYASKAQVWNNIQPGSNVDVARDRVTMFGVPYYYGFPYFPLMFLFYLPFRSLAAGYTSLRLANVLLMLAQIGGAAWLAARLARLGSRRDSALVAAVAVACTMVYVREIVFFGIVDILIAVLALFSFLAVAHRRFRLAGVLFGAAQACKLLPGPLLVLPVLIWLWRRPGFGSVALGYVITAAAFVLPFVAWNPPAFLSATVLYYLTYHAGGDNTALWFFLPEALKPGFLAVGAIVASGALLAPALLTMRNRGGLLAALATSFLSYVVLVAFGKMSHLNYLWGVYPLGCVVLAVATMDPGEDFLGPGET